MFLAMSYLLKSCRQYPSMLAAKMVVKQLSARWWHPVLVALRHVISITLIAVTCSVAAVIFGVRCRKHLNASCSRLSFSFCFFFRKGIYQKSSLSHYIRVQEAELGLDVSDIFLSSPLYTRILCTFYACLCLFKNYRCVQTTTWHLNRQTLGETFESST